MVVAVAVDSSFESVMCAVVRSVVGFLFFSERRRPFIRAAFGSCVQGYCEEATVAKARVGYCVFAVRIGHYLGRVGKILYLPSA